MEVARRAALITVCNKRSRVRTVPKSALSATTELSCKLINWAGSRLQSKGRSCLQRPLADNSGRNRFIQSKVLAPITQNFNDTLTHDNAVDNGQSQKC